MAERQLREFDERDKEKHLARLDCELIQTGVDDWRVVISNVGMSPAKKVRLTWVDKPSVFVQKELDEMFPIDSLNPDKFVSVSALFDKDASPPIDVQLEWSQPDGEPALDRYKLYFS